MRSEGDREQDRADEDVQAVQSGEREEHAPECAVLGREAVAVQQRVLADLQREEREPHDQREEQARE